MNNMLLFVLGDTIISNSLNKCALYNMPTLSEPHNNQGPIP